MHHKFAVLDSTTLLTGSFNWTDKVVCVVWCGVVFVVHLLVFVVHSLVFVGHLLVFVVPLLLFVVPVVVIVVPLVVFVVHFK